VLQCASRSSVKKRAPTKGWLLSALSCALLLLGCIKVVLAQSESLPAPWRQKVYPSAPQYLQFPRVGNGYLWFFRRSLRQPSIDAIQFHSFSTDQVGQIPFWLEGASTVWINDAAITSSLDVLVGGSYFSADSNSSHNFLAIVDPAGNVRRTINVGRFEPEKVCSAQDGDIWTLGQDWQAEATNTSYSMLRNYSSGGKLIHSYLPRKSLPLRKLNWSVREHESGTLADFSKAFLECGTQSVGAYIAGVGTWIEIQLSDQKVQTWRIRRPSPTSTVTGLALLGTHQLYASFFSASRDSGNSQHGLRGLYRVDLSEPSTRFWVLVPGSESRITTRQGFAKLVGSDSSSLVYLPTSSNSAHNAPLCCGPKYFQSHPALFWIKP
jgi:hypothetical protein